MGSSYEAVSVDGWPSAFRVVGPEGAAVEEIDEFLLRLARSGRSAHTLRSYALGLAHFFGWLRERGMDLEGVTTSTIGEYVDHLRTEPKRGACRTDPERAGRTNPLTRKVHPSAERKKPGTVNHRLSVLSSFFGHRAERGAEGGARPRPNPVPSRKDPMEGSHGMAGRDAPRRGRAAEFRSREPETLPKGIEPGLAERIIAAAGSRRDRAILTLLWRTGQRIGDWGGPAGRHGVLGMSLHDLDEKSGFVVVRLKGARDEHRVPVTEDFWPPFRGYLEHERGADLPTEAAWVGLRRGKGRPLSYSAFEASLRYAGRKVGANVNAHMFRHALAQAVVEAADLKTAQEILGHRQISTTAAAYARVDERAMVEAVARARSRSRPRPPASEEDPAPLFAYDAFTLGELERLAEQDGTGSTVDGTGEGLGVGAR